MYPSKKGLNLYFKNKEIWQMSFGLEPEMLGKIKCKYLSNANPLQDLYEDKAGNIWVILEKEIVKITPSGENIIMDSLMSEEILISQWGGGKFCDINDGNIYLPYGYQIFKFNDADSVINLNIKKLGYKFFFTSNILGGYKNYLTFTDTHSDSLFFLDFDNPTDKKSIFLKQDGILPDSFNHIATMNTYNNALYMHCRKTKFLSIPKREKIIVYENDELKPLFIPYFDTVQVQNKVIKSFIISPKGHLVFCVDKIDEDTKALIGCEIVVCDRKGNVLEITEIPENKSNVTGNMEKVYYTHSLCYSRNNLYFLVTSHLFNTVVKLASETVDVEAGKIDGGGMYRTVWLFNACPNPVVGKEATCDFFCMPSMINNMTIEIYDENGTKYPNTSYSIINHNQVTGLGKLKLQLGNIPAGIKYVVIKAGKEMHTEGIIIQ
jgi:hypothetical protein